MDQTVKILGYSVSHTDIVRVFVIISLSLSCILITALSLERQVQFIYTQLFYFPIIYATYFYPRKGLYLAGVCALVFELLSYIYYYPNNGRRSSQPRRRLSSSSWLPSWSPTLPRP